ncbi:MAG: amidase [Ilumatobacteraceae bacterium]
MCSLAAETRWMDATDQAALVRNGEVSATELLDAAIERIESSDHALNAVIIRWFDEARAAAGRLPDGPFRGVPFLLKDLWAHYAGQPLTNGSRALKSALPISPTDTTLVSRFRQAGLNIAGRTNSPEFGSLPTTEPLAWGPTRNPWNLDHSSGGSSGGSAAAVASGMVPFAHASDGGGSIRIPASCCGLVGLKPSQGRITLGPFRDESNLGVELCVSRSVRDTAALLDAVHGPGVGDTVIAPSPGRAYITELEIAPGRLRIGLLDAHPSGGALHDDCRDAVRAAAATLESLGHHVEHAFPAALANRDFGRRFSALWSTNMGVAVQRIEAQLGRPLTDDDVEPVNRAQVALARSVSGVDYALGLAATVEFRRALQQWWADGWDLLLTPTIAEPPATIGTFANDPDSPISPMIRAGEYVPFTPPFNASGQPAISLPLHWNSAGLPVGVQLVAAYAREDVLLRVASQLEAASPWAHRHPAD